MHAAQKSIISLLSTWGIFHSNFPLTSILFILFIQWVSLKESYQIMHENTLDVKFKSIILF